MVATHLDVDDRIDRADIDKGQDRYRSGRASAVVCCVTVAELASIVVAITAQIATAVEETGRIAARADTWCWSHRQTSG